MAAANHSTAFVEWQRHSLLKILHIHGSETRNVRIRCCFPGSSYGQQFAWDAGDPGSIPGWGRSPGVGNGNHSSIFAWRIPWTEEPGELQSQRVGQNWVSNTFIHQKVDIINMSTIFTVWMIPLYLQAPCAVYNLFTCSWQVRLPRNRETTRSQGSTACSMLLWTMCVYVQGQGWWCVPFLWDLTSSWAQWSNLRLTPLAW